MFHSVQGGAEINVATEGALEARNKAIVALMLHQPSATLSNAIAEIFADTWQNCARIRAWRAGNENLLGSRIKS
jgi:hypothetical protein